MFVNLASRQGVSRLTYRYTYQQPASSQPTAQSKSSVTFYTDRAPDEAAWLSHSMPIDAVFLHIYMIQLLSGLVA